MSFSKYTIEKKQVSLDNGKPITLKEYEVSDLEKWVIQRIDDENIPSIICTHPDITSIGSTVFSTYLPSGIAKSVTFVSGMTYCVDTWGSSDNIIIDECHNSSMTAKTATITTGWNPIRAYNSYVLNGRGMISGNFCGEATCYNITEFMPWIDPNGTIKLVYKMHYVKEQSSDDWKIDEEWTPELITFGERWLKVSENIDKTTWQHQIATGISSDNSDLGWKVEWKDEGESVDDEYKVTIPQDVQLIEYLRADGVAASSSGWTDGYQMKVKIDPTNLGIPTGKLAHKMEGSVDEPHCSWGWYIGETSYYVESTCGDFVELTPNEWKCVNIGVVDRAKYAGFFCTVGIGESSPFVSGDILDKTYVGGLITMNDGHMYFPYKIPSNNGFEDEYLNGSEYGFIDREGNKVVLEYVYGKYTNTDGVTQNLNGNASMTLRAPSDAVDVEFADSVTSLPIGVCSDNTVLTSVTMKSVISIGEAAFRGCTSLSGVNIPSTVTEIGEGAFSGCMSLTSINIPSNVTEIGNRAFADCSKLETVNMNSIHPPMVGIRVFTQGIITIPPEADLKEWQTNYYWRLYAGMIAKRESKETFLYRDSSHKGFIADLGVALKDNTKIEIKVKPTSNGEGMIIGEVNSLNDDDDYRFFWFNNRIYYDYGTDRMNSYLDLNIDYVLEIGNYYIKDLTSGSYILQGNAKSGVATAHTRTLGMFGDVNDDHAWIYYIKIYEGDTLVKDFIPVKLEDGSGTLYDNVSNTYCSVSNGKLGVYGL